MTLLAEHDHHFRTDEPGTTDDDDLHLEPSFSEEWKELWSKSLAAVRQGRDSCTAMSRATLSSRSVRAVASTTFATTLASSSRADALETISRADCSPEPESVDRAWIQPASRSHPRSS